MASASCPDCGAEVLHAVTPDGTHVPLERWSSPDGANRYKIVKFGDPHIVSMVTDATSDGYPDHREDCPAHQNGLRGIHFV